MNILYIEPFYSGSHKHWIDSYKKISKHNINILSLPGKHWKWRMHGASITLAEIFMKNNKSYDLIIASDFLNLPLFKSLCHEKLGEIKIVIYFHENQITYPWSPNDQDIKLKRDLHYAFINYSSSLISTHNLFNSQYHLDSYIKGLSKYLKLMPDYNNLNSIKRILSKSSVLYLGCKLDNAVQNIKENETPIILWNNRWEYDKNPELFFNTLKKIKSEGVKFKLVVLGENFNKCPSIFIHSKEIFKNEILHIGYCETRSEYLNWLAKSDILPVTSIQDFFGISIVEAIAMNNYPILPNRLSYPELLDAKTFPEIFYETEKQFHSLIIEVIKNYKNLRNNVSKYRNIINRFNWPEIIDEYDEKFIQIYNS